MRFSSNGFAFSDLGELRDSSDLAGRTGALGERLERDGYLLFRNWLDIESVLAGRRALAEKLADSGFVDRRYPLLEAVSRGRHPIPLYDDSDDARALRALPELTALNRHPDLDRLVSDLIAGPVLSYDHVWIRAQRLGESTGCHYDHVYMGRGTENVYTLWIPLGDVSREEGSLAMLEGSNHFERLIRTYGQIDVDRDKDRLDPKLGGWLTVDPGEPQKAFGGRWLTTDFHAGDVLLFTTYTLHCSLDNRSPESRVRLSIDIRKQPAGEPADSRWVTASREAAPVLP